MKKIIYSPGEPAGIGPDLIIQLCSSKFWTDIKIPILKPIYQKSQLLFDLTKAVNGTVYLSAPGSAVFFEEHNPFLMSKIELKYQEKNKLQYAILKMAIVEKRCSQVNSSSNTKSDSM